MTDTDYTPNDVWRLARWLAGGTNADYTAAAKAWPDLPPDRDLAPAWLEKHPELADAVARIDPAGDPPGGPPLNPYLISADQLLTTDWPEPIWAIPDLLPVGLTILAGKPKVGKSWLALQLAQSVATGGMALDRKVKKGPVLYLALEDPPRRLADRMRKQRWPAGADADFLTIGDFAERVGDLRDGGGVTLGQQIEQRGYRFVAIDTLSRSVYGDQSDVVEMTLALSPLQAAAQEHNCAVAMIDHHRKGFGLDPDAVADILGSTAKGAVADTSWGLYRERGKAGANLHVIGRDVIEQTLALKFDGMTGCWQSEGDPYELELTKRRREIIEALEGLAPIGCQDLAQAIDQDKGNTYRRLQDLTNAGLVVKKGTLYELPNPS